MKRKVLLVAILIISMLLQFVMPLTVVNASTSVEITLNSKLYEALKYQLYKQGINAAYSDANSKITISSDELEKVKTLDLSNSEIDDLTGLSQFSNLTEVNLTANELTADSNLSELSSLNLTTLNLSSNKIESVSAISNFDSIKYSDITNQQISKKEVISVDVSDESDHITTTIIPLPDILTEDYNGLDVDTISITKIGEDGQEVDASSDIDWTELSSGSLELILKTATLTTTSYTANKGLYKIVIDYSKKSSSKLANTEIELYYIVIDSDENAMIFEDENLYKAVKSQLTAGQTENDELASFKDEEGKNTPVTLYKRAYDKPLILVIDENTVINEIPSLILNDKKVKDLTGIEGFVGLETNLNVSYNYIDTIAKILELEQNKETKESEVQTKYSKELETLKENKAKLDEQTKLIKTLEEQIKTKKTELTKLTDESQKEAKANEINDLNKQLADAKEKQAKYSELVSLSEEKLYSIFEKEYKLISLLPTEINELSVEDMLKADLETVKAYAEAVMNRVSSLESSEALTTFEKWAIYNQLKTWGASNGLTFSTTKTVTQIDIEGKETEVEEAIENPITEFFKTVQENSNFFVIADYEEIVYMFKAIDALSQLNIYCEIERGAEGTTDCLAGEALETIIANLKAKNLDTSIYEKISKVDSCEAINAEKAGEAYCLELKKDNGAFMAIHIGLATDSCKGTATELNAIAGRLAAVTAEEISHYVELPRIEKLVIDDNKIESLAGLESLTELKELSVYKNIIDDITDVDWSTFKYLEVLNLGYNQLSNVKDLENISTLKTLNLSRNMLSGNFDFCLTKLKDLESADFSYNQYENIKYLMTQYAFIAKGKNMTVTEYLRSDYAPSISFKYQTLQISTTALKTGNFITIDLPAIFAQFEEIDYDRTSFGVTSQNGTVLADGTQVKLSTPSTGEYQGTVTVEGNNGTGNYSTEGIGYGSTCIIKYNIVDTTVQEPAENPGGTEEIPGTTVDGLEYGYTVSNGYVYVAKPETTLADFANQIVSSDDYTVTVKDNKSATNIATGAVVSIDNKLDGSNVTILEVVVKGDVNGDGKIDALDSGIIRATINDTYAPIGVYQSAADVNNDGDIDSLDALLVLQYRADKISSFGN